MTDTLKEAEAEAEAEAGATALGPRVARTMSRSGLWRAQTPQGFPRPMLESAFRLARSTGYVGTDEAALVERLGGTVHLVPDRSTNLKVTTPADLRLADALAAGGR